MVDNTRMQSWSPVGAYLFQAHLSRIYWKGGLSGEGSLVERGLSGEGDLVERGTYYLVKRET